MIQRVITDLPVLAKNTLQITIGKENITNSLTSAYNRFFSLMNTDGGDTKLRSCLTISLVLRKPVSITFPGTNIAVSQFFKRFIQIFSPAIRHHQSFPVLRTCHKQEKVLLFASLNIIIERQIL